MRGKTLLSGMETNYLHTRTFIPEYSGDRNNCLRELRRCNTHTSMRGASANVTMVDEKSLA